MEDQVIIQDSIPPGPNNTIGPGPTGGPKGPPAGYKPITGTPPVAVMKVARSLLGGSFGTTTPFSIGDIHYMARIEPHWHPLDYTKGPRGWHKGCSVYIAANQELPTNSNLSIQNQPISINNPKSENVIDSGRLQFLQRIDKFLNNLE